MADTFSIPSPKPANRATDYAGVLNTSQPHPARRYDYWLGGKDNFAGDRIAAAFPTVRAAAAENRYFLQRVVSYLAAEAGIRQFLDIGTGIPNSPNVHEIAQRIAPATRVGYVDNDPMVVMHGRCRLTATPQGAVAYLQADLRDPDSILQSPVLKTTLDLSQPVAVLLCAVLHFIPDQDQPAGIIAHIADALPHGSYLALSHATLDPLTTDTRREVTRLFAAGASAGHGIFQTRTRGQIAALLGGLPVVDPGLVPLVRWRPDRSPHPQASEQDAASYAAVACIP